MDRSPFYLGAERFTYALIGHPFMTSTRKSGFNPPLSTCVHMSLTSPPLWTSTCSQHEIHTLSWNS